MKKDDVIEVDSFEHLPEAGEVGKIYVTKDTNLLYRWTGVKYVEVSESLHLGETADTAYAGDKGKETTDKVNSHISDFNNPHKVTAEQVGLGNVDNTSDLNKPISTATQTVLNQKVDSSDLAIVATTGSYNDLSNKPIIPFLNFTTKST